MRRWRLWIARRLAAARDAAESGSATLELITTGLILMVPLVYLVLTLATIQAGAFAVEGAARQAARVYVQSANEQEAVGGAERAIRFALADAGLSEIEPTVDVRCAPNPNACLTRKGTVTIAVALTVPLPFVPPVLTVAVPLGVPLQAAATEQVSRFWGAG
ncbi:MAG: hypothetical protein ABIW81_00800 [Terrimesophilobacter sp.]